MAVIQASLRGEGDSLWRLTLGDRDFYVDADVLNTIGDALMWAILRGVRRSWAWDDDCQELDGEDVEPYLTAEVDGACLTLTLEGRSAEVFRFTPDDAAKLGTWLKMLENPGDGYLPEEHGWPLRLEVQ